MANPSPIAIDASVAETSSNRFMSTTPSASGLPVASATAASCRRVSPKFQASTIADCMTTT